jgi:hypothetical protein
MSRYSTHWKRASVFIYNPKTGEATVVNRNRSENNHLFYSSLSITGSVNRAGKAKFNVVNIGDAVYPEVSGITGLVTNDGLIDAGNYVAIILGRDVIWSGKILRAVSKTQGLYPASIKFGEWEVSCESDISKMKEQPPYIPANNSVVNTIGGVVSTICRASDSSYIDWTGKVVKSLISLEGAKIVYDVKDADLYSQFISLANISGFDWRTRLQSWYGTGSFDGDVITLSAGTFSPYSEDDFVGKFVLFLHDSNSDSTENIVGVVSWGLVTGNTDTTITVTAHNGGIPPTPCDFLVLLDPVVDFAWDLSSGCSVNTLHSNDYKTRDGFVCYGFDDRTDKKNLATKVTVKAKNIDTSLSNTGASNTVSTTLTAINLWDKSESMFENTTICTQKLDGYIYSYTAGATTIRLIGKGYSLRVGDSCWVAGKTDDNLPIVMGPVSITSVTEVAQTDGTQTTDVGISESFKDSGSTSHTVMKYSVFAACKTYVSDPSRLYSDFTGGKLCRIGGSNNIRECATTGVDSEYGYYISLVGSTPPYFGEKLGDAVPIFPGCLIRSNTESADSPLKTYGEIRITKTVDQAITRGELEIYATQALINHSYYLRKGNITCPVFEFFKPGTRTMYEKYDWEIVKEGDRITVLVGTGDGYNADDVYKDGQFKYQWEVMSWSFDSSTMQFAVELGDYEENVFTLLNSKTSSIDRNIT